MKNWFGKISLVVFLAGCAWMISCTEQPTTCTENSNCATGQVCTSGKCVAKTTTDASPSDGPAVCVSNADCKTTEVCKDKKCEPKPLPCEKDNDCKSTEICKDKICVLAPTTCEKNEDCGSNRVCKDKKCEKLVCQYDEQCTEGFSCQVGTCVPAAECDEKTACPTGQICNTCRKTCTFSLGSDKCSEDYNCVSGGGSDNMWCDKCIKECRARKKVCAPCVKDEECGDENDLCLPDQKNPNSGLKFCGRACTAGVCSPGYVCKDFAGKKQCAPASGDCSNPAECQATGDCPAGKVCDPRSKVCIEGCKENESCGLLVKGNCSQASDCSNPSAKCQNNQCTTQKVCNRGVCEVPCSTNSDCEQQETCKEGRCQYEGECRSSKDCPDKHYCDSTTSLCKPGCQTADDCGIVSPQRDRCRNECNNNKCEENCKCRTPALDCAKPIRFCPLNEKPDELVECRKPVGPICKPCSANIDCACKAGDDCKYICSKQECKEDTDCASMPGGATKCYNERCSTKKACNTSADCPSGEKCENKFCAESCNNLCVNLQSGPVCFTGCDPLGDGSECPSRAPCIEMLPQEGTGDACNADDNVNCKKDADCPSKIGICGPDGRCTSCSNGKVCRNLDRKDPLKWICIEMPPTICADFSGVACKESGL